MKRPWFRFTGSARGRSITSTQLTTRARRRIESLLEWPIPAESEVGRFIFDLIIRSYADLRCPHFTVGAAADADAKIDFLHLLILFQIGRLAFEHRAAGLQHIGVVGDVERERNRLLGEPKSQSVLAQTVQGLVER